MRRTGKCEVKTPRLPDSPIPRLLNLPQLLFHDRLAVLEDPQRREGAEELVSFERELRAHRAAEEVDVVPGDRLEKEQAARAKRLPQLGKGLGEGISNFKRGLKGNDSSPPLSEAAEDDQSA